MTKARDLARLADLAQLMLDHRLGTLRQAADAVEQSRMQLQAINAASAPADLPPVAAERVGLAYQRWADVRRSELNLVISRQTAEWIEARGEAGTAFGRLQALQGLAARSPNRR
ncbi:hypothetical protein [Tabrizicola sp.]|uniref:hypothetical protein n=1 Tax=Tabrizicola sp. TaxID=2005166 RepID=UPI003F2A34B6